MKSCRDINCQISQIMLAPDIDVAILGGGCAGLSLAVRLAQSNLSVHVIEPRSTYINDRTWSFWRTCSDPFETCVRKEWSFWAVSGDQGCTTRTSSYMRYQSVDSGAFYKFACDTIAKSNQTQLSLGVSAEGVERLGTGWKVTTSTGTFTAKTVVDTRPPKRTPIYGQFFLGREIKTERPVFDSDVVQLMQFRRARSTGVDFVYILPFSANQALVEVTSFAPSKPSHQVFSNWLDIEIDALSGGHIETLRTESGSLPMEANFADIVPDGMIRMGLGGCAARPSTGYAFSRIQMQADQVALALMTDKVPKTQLDGSITQFMDRVFLQVLSSSPSRGAAYFETLFRKAPRDKLERFLSGSTRTADRLSVMASLPPLPFLRATLCPI